MKRAFATLLFTTVSLVMSTTGHAATEEQKSAYKAAKNAAFADYKVNRAKCDTLSGTPKKVCAEEASAVRIKARQEAEVAYKNTPKAIANARKEIAEANYGVAKAKCGAKTGNEKRACIKEAKTVMKTAKVDAATDKKVTEVRVDRRGDKRDEQFRVASEKCDALTGIPRDTCMTNAKVTYGK